MNTQILVPATLLDNVIQFVEVSSVFGKRAYDEIGVHRQCQTKAAALRPALLEYMIASGVTAPHQKEAADAMLADHAATLQLLKAAVVELKNGGTKKAGDNGQAVDPTTLSNGSVGQTQGNVSGSSAGAPLTKEGEYDSLNDPFVGRQTSLMKASDRCLMPR